MKKLILFACLFVLLLSTACGEELVFEADSSADCLEDEIYDPDEGVCYAACLDDGSCEVGGGFLDFLGSFLDGLGNFTLADGENVDPFIVYEIEGDDIALVELRDVEIDDLATLQADEETHLAMWELFVALIPATEREWFSQYMVFTDGFEETMAYVEPDPDQPDRWILALDIADIDNRDEFVYTIVHEYGHVLTLNQTQVPLDEEAYFGDDEAFEAAAEACNRFFTGEGCSLPTSYIDAFFHRFWVDLHEENIAIDPEDVDALADFYDAYADQFVSEYAATNPGEDIAESWTRFVLSPRPSGRSIADQKVLFFYEYPELVALREAIATNLGRLR